MHLNMWVSHGWIRDCSRICRCESNRLQHVSTMSGAEAANDSIQSIKNPHVFYLQTSTSPEIWFGTQRSRFESSRPDFCYKHFLASVSVRLLKSEDFTSTNLHPAVQGKVNLIDIPRMREGGLHAIFFSISVSCASMPHARRIYDVDAPFRQLRIVSLHLLPVAIST
jgi:hypothetical protein